MSRLTALGTRYTYQRNTLQSFRRGLKAIGEQESLLLGLDPHPNSVMQCHYIPGYGVTPPARMLKIWKCGVGTPDRYNFATYRNFIAGAGDDYMGIQKVFEPNPKRKRLFAFVTGLWSGGANRGLVIDFNDGPPQLIQTITNASNDPIRQYLDRGFRLDHNGDMSQPTAQGVPRVVTLFPCPTTAITMVSFVTRFNPADTSVTLYEQIAK